MGYITTPEEYDLQHYEGGHTLFGINSLDEYIKVHRMLQKSSD
jgi:neutral ceramidase